MSEKLPLNELMLVFFFENIEYNEKKFITLSSLTYKFNVFITENTNFELTENVDENTVKNVAEKIILSGKIKKIKYVISDGYYNIGLIDTKYSKIGVENTLQYFICKSLVAESEKNVDIDELWEKYKEIYIKMQEELGFNVREKNINRYRNKFVDIVEDIYTVKFGIIDGYKYVKPKLFKKKHPDLEQKKLLKYLDSYINNMNEKDCKDLEAKIKYK